METVITGQSGLKVSVDVTLNTKTIAILCVAIFVAITAALIISKKV
jgi:hypothetical protein